MLIALLAASWSPLVAFSAGQAVWVIPAVYLLPIGVAAWIVRRRVQYVERKHRFIAGQNVCLDCGYDIGDVPQNRPETQVCPECGEDIAARMQRSIVTIPESFVFRGLERAASDERARAWLSAAPEHCGWAARHRLFALFLLLLAIGCFFVACLQVVEMFMDAPEWLNWAFAGLIGMGWITGIWFFERRWFRRMTTAIDRLSHEPAPASGLPTA